MNLKRVGDSLKPKKKPWRHASTSWVYDDKYPEHSFRHSRGRGRDQGSLKEKE